MNINGILKQHWLHVSVHFAVDAFIFWIAFLIGTYLRVPGEVDAKLVWPGILVYYWPGILFGSLFFSSAIYIFGLYSPQSSHQGALRRSLIIGLCLAATLALMFAMFYIKKSTAIGRGVMWRSCPIAYFMFLLHHGLLLHWLKNYRERVAFVVSCAFDEDEARLFQSIGQQSLELAGLVHYGGYQPSTGLNVIGHAADFSKIVEQEEISRILCTNKSMSDPAMSKQFCELRYSGVTVMPLVNLFEEVHQLVPLELVTPEWLLNASGLPHMLYIKKLKRGFDIACSLAGLVFLGPVMLLAMALIRLTSPGPVVYRQKRCGRFGRAFEVIKLRTMRMDAEKGGAVWAAENDPRVTPVGNLLRRYRIDEFPQLINVLRGEMSFVGPRPERPEFIGDLAQQVSFYQERLMVQPGITGWAQVNYPYGSSVEDARRKLEYDLYYMKHMSLFLDLFILLDTVRIVLRGGLREAHKRPLPRLEEMRAAWPKTEKPLRRDAVATAHTP
jgi:exopolysaccharide biosynthesis polyprenyl glycosylphosphotransferase